MPKRDCRSFENARVGIVAQQVDSRAQAFLGKCALRHPQLSEDVCCASTDARIIRGCELERFVEYLATAEPLSGRHRCPIAATVLAILPTLLFAISPTFFTGPVCGCGKQFGNGSRILLSHAYAP